MDDFLNNEFQKSLRTGFIDRSFFSNALYQPELLVNSKENHKKVLTSISQELKRCHEFLISVAFVTTSGVATLINDFELLQSRGIKGKVLVSQYLNFTQPEALKRLLQFDNIELKIATQGNFHSKGYLFRINKYYNLIIGSSNMTATALSSNTEWNLKVSAIKESSIVGNVLDEFNLEFKRAILVTSDFISDYQNIYEAQRAIERRHSQEFENKFQQKTLPNAMQKMALSNLVALRNEGKNKALLISATGTGKTFLSAFDAKAFSSKRLLFVVHRLNIAKAAMKSFQAIFGKSKTMGIYSGAKKEVDKEFIFSTVQTFSKEEHLNHFAEDYFDYIIIDESHRSGANSYLRIINHFKPTFLLGMTATPERTDGLDIFKLFDHNIAFEIRLDKAMEEEMLSPFHYYGITDISVNGELLEEDTDFLKLTSDERVDRIIEKIRFYGCDDGNVRGLIFCSKREECKALSKRFNERGYKTVALTGDSQDKERAEAIRKLESDNSAEKLDYIFTVDIFNEGIDIPRVNQVVMLRPTQSAIIFVQQLGRGLRKIDKKEYLTVIDQEFSLYQFELTN